MKEKKIQVELNIKGFHPYYLNRVIVLLVNKLVKTNLKVFVVKKQVFLPKRRKRFTLLRSPHVDKKARDTFERVTCKRSFILTVELTEKSILYFYRFLKYISSLNIGASLEVKYKHFTKKLN